MYTVDSSIVGYVPIRPGWREVLTRHGAVPDADTILAAYDRWCLAYHLDPNLALAQMCQEATYGTSVRWRTEWNPAGLGVTSNSTPPHPFKTPQEGIQAHAEHLCCYVYDLAECPADHAHLADRRHVFHDGMPRVRDLVRLPARAWANPGTNYAAAIVAIANSIPDTGGSPVTEPWDRIHLSADDGGPRDLSAVQWFVVHDTEGRFAGDESVLTSAAAPIESVHFLIGRLAGQCIYSVPIGNVAWTAGNDELSELAVQVELSKAPDESGYTDYQYGKLAEVFRWCRDNGMAAVPPVYLGLHPKDDNHGPLPDDPGIIGHAGVPNPNGLGASPAWGGIGGHTDPGPDFQWDRFIALIAGAAPPAPSDVEFFAETGHNLGGGFRAFWHGRGGLDIFGFPVSDERTEGGVTVQYFERAKFELHGEAVQLARLGAAAAAAAGLTGPGIP